MSNRLIAKCVCWAGISLIASLACASTGVAHPPVTVRGIELPTVLSFYDRAREAAVAAGGDRVEDETADDEANGLETVDTIVLDPGHGAGNLGAIGVTGVAEKYLTLELAYELRKRLQKRFPDLRVVLTRYWDSQVGLDDRTHMANRIGADLFLSLHYNAASHQRAVGYETYFLDTRKAIPGRHQQAAGKPIASLSPHATGVAKEDDTEPFGVQGDQLAIIRRDLQRAHQHQLSGMLAETVQSSLGANLESIDRGVKQANFAVLRGALMPAVVVEAGFLTHPDEGEACLQAEHRDRVVDGLVEAVRRFDRKQAGVRSYRADNEQSDGE